MRRLKTCLYPSAAVYQVTAREAYEEQHPREPSPSLMQQQQCCNGSKMANGGLQQSPSRQQPPPASLTPASLGGAEAAAGSGVLQEAARGGSSSSFGGAGGEVGPVPSSISRPRTLMAALMLLGVVSLALPMSSTRGHWQGMAINNSGRLDSSKGLALKMHQQQQQQLVLASSSLGGIADQVSGSSSSMDGRGGSGSSSSSSVAVSDSSEGSLPKQGKDVVLDASTGTAAAAGVGGVGAWPHQMVEQQPQQQQPQERQGKARMTPPKHNPVKGWALTLVSEDVTYILGTSFGYASSVLYLCSRVSQIHKNYSRKSAEGLALAMFMMAACANMCTGTGILLRTFTWEELKEQAPWIIGTLGTISLDMVILWQSQVYGQRKVVAGGEAGGHLPRGDDGNGHHSHRSRHYHVQHEQQQEEGYHHHHQHQQQCGENRDSGEARGAGRGAEGLHVRRPGVAAVRGGEKELQAEGRDEEINAPLLLSQNVTVHVEG